ncbi:hypothetical protein Vau01_046540 [Virgisporangium aurantiacum]|uniref:DUF2690 domain-containing protein n=1 Tax=Virgisporangium aurantiacum TaxID=175570 RepID=A0A8J3Z689_9ACTN|nr:hypothetical protein Vau01_046540 [Virgisporangium aurantiacum]
MQFATAPARAATCWGDYCSGQDPEAAGCSADASPVAAARIPGTYSYVELRWSPSCKTNWARVPAAWGTAYPWQLRATQCATGYQQSGVVGNNANYAWTRMIYSPTLRVRAEWNGQPGSVWTACG